MPWFRKEKYTKLDPPKKRDRIPQDLMIKCESCLDMLLKEDFEKDLWVCPSCDYHSKLTAWDRIKITFDDFEEDNKDLKPMDPLNFYDTKPYAERLATYQKATGLNDACISGLGTIHGYKMTVAVMDINFGGGSMGSVVGEKIARAMDRAYEERLPAVVFACGGGARMQEGILSLMQMAKTSASVGRLRKSGMPFISVLTNPTTGGTLASFASLGDLVIAEPHALIGFAGPRVIEQTIRQILPKDFQTSEFVRDKGFIDMVVHRRDLKSMLAKFMSFLSGQVNPRFPSGEEAAVIDTKDVL